MRYLLLFVLLSSVFTCVYAQTEPAKLPYEYFEKANHQKKKKINGETYYIFNTDALKGLQKYANDSLMLDGVAYEVQDDQYVQVVYKQGVKEGPMEGFFYTGEKSIEGKFVDGKLDGEVKTFFTNGQINSIAHYQSGVLEGDYVSYFENGEKREEIKYSEEGNKRDIKSYYLSEDGEAILNNEYTTVNEVQEGFDIYYHSNGQISSKVNYVNGNREGEEIYYYQNGEISNKYYYVNNLLEGDHYSFFEDGRIQSKTFYKENKLEGPSLSYQIQDDIYFLRDSAYYVNGKLEGTNIYYSYDSDSAKVYLSDVYNYKNNALDGERISYYSSGDTSYYETYREGQLHGLYKNFYINDWNEAYVSYTGDYAFTLKEGEFKSFRYYYLEEDTVLYNDGIYNFKNGLQNGKSYTFNYEGDTISIENYVDGKKEGEAIIYTVTPSGRKYISKLANYKEGNLDGKVFRYDSLNRLVYEEEWVKGYQEGIEKNFVDFNNIWNPSPTTQQFKLYMTSEYVKGELNGERNYFDSLGRIVQVENFKNGIRHGKNVFFGNRSWYVEEDTSFFKLSEDHYVGGLLEGNSYSYNSDGQVIEKGNYVFNKLHGDYFWFDQTGEDTTLYATRKANYKNGIKTFEEYYRQDASINEQTYYNEFGKMTLDIYFFDSGDTSSVTHYVNDFREGTARNFGIDWDTSTPYLSYTEEYKNDVLHGDVIEYNVHGKVTQVTPYKYGIKQGVEVSYFYNEKIVREENTYFNGVLISQKMYGDYYLYEVKENETFDEILKESIYSKELILHYNPSLDIEHLPVEINLPHEFPYLKEVRKKEELIK